MDKFVESCILISLAEHDAARFPQQEEFVFISKEIQVRKFKNKLTIFQHTITDDYDESVEDCNSQKKP